MDLPPLNLSHLFRPLELKLMELLRSLSPEEWEAQTVARLWKVKDVAAHLLDGNIRLLSLQRDRYFGFSQPPIKDNKDLVNWLNEFNREWVDAAKRISPPVMIFLHEATGGPACDYFESMDPYDKAIFAVAWAGESESLNWMHQAREYTEKWLHQQQIRDAVGKQGIMTPEFFFPFIQTFAYALPFTYRDVSAPNGTLVRLTVTSAAGGSFDLEKGESSWKLVPPSGRPPHAELELEPDTAWKLFSKSLRPEDVRGRAVFKGDQELAAKGLQMVSVMA